MSRGEVAPLGPDAAVVAAVFATSGTVHLVRPQVFEGMIPRRLPARRAIVHVSGLAELGCAAGLVTGRRWAPAASAALLVAIWPGNWQLAFDVQSRPDASSLLKVAVWARLPLQLVMIRAVLRGRPGRRRPARR